MARIDIDKVTVRNRLLPQREPYWGAPLDRGLYLGFRKLDYGGAWIARQRVDGKQRYRSIGPEAIEYADAAKAARRWGKTIREGVDTSAVRTVADACRDYVKDRRREKGEASASDTAARYRRYVYDDPIGNVTLHKLRTAQLKDWRARLPMRTPEGRNRDLAGLKAALNHAVTSRYVDTGRAVEWANVRPEPTTGRKDLYLDRDERAAVVAALPEHMHDFARCLCLVPLRPGALEACRVRDYDPAHGTLYIRKDKAGAGRTVAVPTAALKLLKVAGRGVDAPLIPYRDGTAWTNARRSQIMKRVVRRAVEAGTMRAGTCLYTFRHSVITDMLTAGMDSLTVARMAGTSLAMIEKHYGHLLMRHARDAMDAMDL